MTVCASTSQTVGPFFHLGLSQLNLSEVAGPQVTGERITLEGVVLDGDRNAVPDALVEIWQANAHGKYAHEADRQEKPLEPGFRGYGRLATSPDGFFQFHTILPGRVPGPQGTLQAPHIEVCVFMRGLLKQLVTRVYFEGDPANEDDFVLNLIEPARRATLIAQKAEEGGSVYRWNILLQGQDETVFFDV
jgi:protocatechuate 3,4-dioxygenase, alpha subunit